MKNEITIRVNNNDAETDVTVNANEASVTVYNEDDDERQEV